MCIILPTAIPEQATSLLTLRYTFLMSHETFRLVCLPVLGFVKNACVH